MGRIFLAITFIGVAVIVFTLLIGVEKIIGGDFSTESASRIGIFRSSGNLRILGALGS